MSLARTLVRNSLDHPALIDRITDDASLAGAGVNSGELIRLALRIEDHLGRQLEDDELLELTSILAVAELVGNEAA
ncbi:acyl carrier protein [Streptomyces sp. NBC_00873]|uniref:acyl carrier protein n=1 Tax=unclassified Streptomyces TaxID=2593676 RepID=UPI003866E20B|nr:acyl carrier protein [Streptomyces sp. NBC_00873]WTA47519.1 acyl carrier protein [Streptomyces sp. NBC_00842]